MKALRRSIKGDRDKPQISIAPKSAVAIVPPKKVIRALYDYEARSSQELGFSRGDFFHVIGRENDSEWYEACNPALPDARGLVPVNFFQALGRTERDSQQSADGMSAKAEHDSGYSENGGSGGMSAMTSPSAPATQSQRSSKNGGKPGMVYGIVMYDFQAERADELEAKAGEAIIVIAQSNPEWFVAKPIGRLGGPGLIPVSFVEIRDMASNTAVSNQQDAIKRAGIPRVEEWKKMAADYKNSSITLGKFEVAGATPQPPSSLDQGMDRLSLQNQGGRMSTQQNGGYQPQQQQPQQAQSPQQPQTYQQQRGPSDGSQFGGPGSDLPAPISARIPRYCFAEDKYWFVIDTMLDDGRHWELSRYYEDFYDFQIALLTEFPAEAGNTGTQKRTLPYMPGPVNYVTDAITEGRLHNLDAYVKNLLAQPAYIAKCTLVRQFFAPREGDYELDPANEGDYRLSGGSHPSSTDTPGGDSRQGSKNNLNGGYGSMQQQQPRQMGGMGQPYMTQPSQTSLNTPMGQSQQGAAAMKVKLAFNDEVVAIRVATDIAFDQLYDKVRERLKIPPENQINMSFKDEPTGERPPMTSDNDLDYALNRNEKLLLYVDLA